VSDLRAEFTDAPQYDLLLCNPPQLAGPPALGVARPDRYAGPEGVDYYTALARLANTALKPAGRVALMQTSLSSFAAVRQ
jgi:methylase of polypeptide subunit release factors